MGDIRDDLRGAYIALDGGDGCGKSTIHKMVVERIEELGVEVVTVREPGGTLYGDAIREILLYMEPAGDAPHQKLHPMTALLLFSAARAQLMREKIWPTVLEGKKCVVADRTFISSYAYQGYGDHIPLDTIKKATDVALAGLTCAPKPLIVLDVSHAEAERRLTETGATRDRIETLGDEYHMRVRQGFAAVHEYYVGATVINAEGDINEVFQAAMGCILGSVRR